MIVRKTKIDNFKDAVNIVSSSGCDTAVIEKLAKKAAGSVFIIDDMDNRALNILKQEALACGTDTAVNINISKFKKGKSTAVICATKSQAEKLALKISGQPFGLKELSEKIKNLLIDDTNKVINCTNKKITLSGEPLVMGIINLSADSFFGNGINEIQKAADTALEMEENGADIIDVGAESTLYGSKPVNAKDETKKVSDFFKLFIKRTKLPVSVDTYKPEVAKAALQEGANIINDIYALRYKSKLNMAKIISDAKAGVILMHMNGTPATMNNKKHTTYKNIVLDIFKFFQERISYSLNEGIKNDSIILDPGIGFGKTPQDNILIIKKFFDFKSLGYPLLAGISNKSFLSKIADIKDIKDREFASITACIKAAENGADILRVHNVTEMKRTLIISNAIRRA